MVQPPLYLSRMIIRVLKKCYAQYMSAVRAYQGKHSFQIHLDEEYVCLIVTSEENEI